MNITENASPPTWGQETFLGLTRTELAMAGLWVGIVAMYYIGIGVAILGIH